MRGTGGAGGDGVQSPIVKFLPDEVLARLLEDTAAAAGDLLFFGAGQRNVVNDSLAALRVRIGRDLGAARVRLASPVGRGFPDVRVGAA